MEQTALLLAACQSMGEMDNVTEIYELDSIPRILCTPKPNANYWERVLVSWDDDEYLKNLRLHR